MSIKTKQFEAFSQMEFLHWNNIWGQAMPYKTRFTWNFVIDGHVVCNFLVASIYDLKMWKYQNKDWRSFEGVWFLLNLSSDFTVIYIRDKTGI